MLTFTPETDDDISTIRSLVTAAFGRTSEAKLIEAIRASPNFIPELSLIAAEDGNALGHILFSPIVIESHRGTVPSLALAPLAVMPLHQHQGIGTQLVQAGLSKCRELDHSIIVVLGEPHYYGRFGFQTASQFGIQAPFPVPEQVFMVLELKPGALMNVSGTVRYPAYFDEV